MSLNGNSSEAAALSTKVDDREIFTLSTGVRVRFSVTNPMLIQAAMARIKDPQVPVIVDKEQGREYTNPNDPAYLVDLAQANVDRGYARINTIILWGVELVDGMPEDNSWLYKLQFQEKQGDLDLSSFDFDNPIDREFAYKKYVAIGDKVDKNGLNVDITLIMDKGTVDEEAIEQASDTFQSEETRAANQDGPVKEPEIISK